MEHRRKIEFGSEFEGCEPVPGDAEKRERLVVGAPAEKVGKYGCPGVVAVEHPCHRVDQGAAEFVLEADILMHDDDLDVVADECANLGEYLFFFTGKGADVDEGFGVVGDDVVLVSGVEEGGVRGRSQGSTDESGCGAGGDDEFVGADLLRIFAEDAGEFRDEGCGGVGEGNGPFVAAEGGDGGGEFGDGVVVHDPGAVGGGAAGDQLDPDERLLAGLEQVGTRAPEGDRVAADFADRFGGAVEEFRMFVDQKVRSEPSAVFFVGEERNDDVAGWLLSGLEDVAEGGDHHRIHVFHIDSASTPEEAVFDDTGEWVDGPVGRVGGDDIGVSVEHEGRARVSSFDPSDDRYSAGFGFEEAGFQAEGVQFGLEVGGSIRFSFGAAFAVVGRVESDEVAGDDRGLVEGGIVWGGSV